MAGRRFRRQDRQTSPGLWDLVWVYGKIGLLGFGGGYAVLSFIHEEVVTKRAWLSGEQFDHVLEMTSFAPGATTVNVLAAIAYRLRGATGLVLATAAALLPSFLLILVLARLTAVLRSPWVVGAMRGIEVAVIGLLVDVVVTLARDVPHMWLTVGIGLAAMLLTVMGMNSALVVAGSASLGALDFALRRKTIAPVSVAAPGRAPRGVSLRGAHEPLHDPGGGGSSPPGSTPP